MVGDILQPTHLLFILVVALLVLGPKRLPEVGRTLGSGLRDFRAAINGESRGDPPPRAYVETEPDPVSLHESDASDGEPAGFDLAAEDLAETDDPEDAPATPTALHDHQLDPEAAGEDLHAPATVEDLHPPEPTDDLRATDDLQAPDATDDLQAPTAADDSADLAPVAAVSSNGFASALASSRQRPAADSAPTADDE